MDQSNDQKLNAAIKLLLASDPMSSDQEIAISVSTTDPAMFAEWAMGKLTAQVRGLRNRIKPSDPAQAVFPFHDLSIQIPLGKDRAVEFGGATIGLLKQSEKYLMAKRKEAIDNPRSNSLHGRIQREIELMQPYVYAAPKITAGQVHALIAAGTSPPPRGKAMSEAMKRYWNSFAPEERSAIAQERQAKRRRKQKGAGA